jgi:hypothetical protein
VRQRGRQLAFAAGLGAVVVISIELALQALALVSAGAREILASPWDAQASAPTVSDARLEFRPNPALRGHDANGFRNPRVPERAEVVALGDSQTYGIGVAADAAWPRVLERSLGRSTYGMAAGGYGPVHGLILLEDALRLQPGIVIEALYAGNDLYDAYRLVYEHGEFPALRSSEALEAIRAAEARQPLVAHVIALGAKCLPQLAAPASEPAAPATGPLRRIASWSKTYGLARRLRYELVSDREPDLAPGTMRAVPAESPGCVSFAADSARTVLMPEYRLAALDTGDPRIREGERLALWAVREMGRVASRAGVRLIVLGIPTKELAFAALGAAEVSPACAELVRREQRFWAEAQQVFAEARIEFVDALGPLRVQLQAGPQPYQESADGHPNEVGHRVIAGALAAYLAERAQ